VWFYSFDSEQKISDGLLRTRKLAFSSIKAGIFLVRWKILGSEERRCSLELCNLLVGYCEKSNKSFGATRGSYCYIFAERNPRHIIYDCRNSKASHTGITNDTKLEDVKVRYPTILLYLYEICAISISRFTDYNRHIQKISHYHAVSLSLKNKVH
jgi:hypothetical protein